MRALLDKMREHRASVTANLAQCRDLLQQASLTIKILDPELGEKELIESSAAELAILMALIAENSKRQ